MLLITMVNQKAGSWNGKSVEKDAVKGKVIRDLPKEHHISEMLKNSKNGVVSWGFYFDDGWDYSVTIKKINYREKPKNMCEVAYPQILDLLLFNKDFATNNNFFSAKKAFDLVRQGVQNG